MEIKRISPPALGERILGIFYASLERESLAGDLEEIYAERLSAGKKWNAGFWYWTQILKSVGRALTLTAYWSWIMFKHYLKIAWRHLRRQKSYSVVNFAGLAIGLSVTLVIALYVLDDITYDRFHKNADQIYRILSIGVKRGTKNSITAGPLVQAAMVSIPEVKYATRVTGGGRLAIGPVGTDFRNLEQGRAVEAQAIAADTHFFDIFSFKILEGESGEALGRPDSVFLTPRKAKALFGDRNPVGESIAVAGMENARVAGIIEAPPTNSHLQFEMILPLIPERNPVWWNNWENLSLCGYVLLEKNTDPGTVAAKMKAIAAQNKFPDIFEPRLQPLADVHLGSSDHYYDILNLGRSDKSVFYTMGFAGVLVLVVACINFINLTTSRASRRALEVGLRKVVGSNKKQLVGQFLGESVLMTVLAFAAALLVVKLTLPSLNIIMKKTLSLDFKEDFVLLLIFFAVAVGIGLLSGIYPSFILSSFRPVNVLRGEFKTGRKGVLLRRSLVVFQFAITTVLIVGVLIVFAQIHYLRSMDLGYNRSQVMAVFSPVAEGDDLLKQRVAALPSVVSVGRIDSIPGPNFTRWEISPEGFDRKDNFTASRFFIDEDAFKTLEITVGAGRGYSREYPTDATDGIIVNETLVRKANYTDPVGRIIRCVDDNGRIIPKRIIGVTKDFHYQTARQKPEPMIFFLDKRQSPLLMVRIVPGQSGRVLSLIQEMCKQLFPNIPFRSVFLDETFDQQFNRDRDFLKNISLFAGLAIFIACLGLTGLIAYSIEQRNKEIAIRKILGCRGSEVYKLLAMDFIKWVLLANLFAWPAAYLVTRRWLRDFSFRVPFQPWPFLLASLATLVIALGTISFQTLRAARAKPINALREVG